MNFLNRILVHSPWRVSILYQDDPSGYGGSETTPSFDRTDGGDNNVGVDTTWVPSTFRREIALTSKLIPDVFYDFHQYDEVISFAYVAPKATSVVRVADDPEAEVFGVDIDWLAPALDPGGDTPEIRGRDCVIRDLIGVAFTQRGEIFHRPESGAGLQQKVNAPNQLVRAGEISALVKRAWTDDDRVAKAAPQISTTTTGEVRIRGDIETVALPQLKIGIDG